MKTEAKLSSGLERSDPGLGEIEASPTCAARRTPQERKDESRRKGSLAKAFGEEENAAEPTGARSRVPQEQKDENRSQAFWRFGAKRHNKKSRLGCSGSFYTFSLHFVPFPYTS